jgi:hypothetical protein
MRDNFVWSNIKNNIKIKITVKRSKYSCSQIIKTSLIRIFQLFTKVFFLYYHISSRVIWYLAKYNKKKQKKQSHVQHLEACGRRSHISSDTCGVSWHPKISFYRVVGSAVMFFFLVEWSVSTRIVQFVVNWPFSFLFFFLPQELHLGPICYLYFNFSPYFFNFCSWSFYRSFICF